MNNLIYKEFHRRDLPHIQPKNCILFVTYRLHNPLPKKMKAIIHNSRKYFVENLISIDDYLDTCKVEPKWLGNPDIAKIVFDNLLKMNNKQYKLFCFCIMPNHVHVLLKPLIKKPGIPFSLSEILHGHKGVTARMANKYLKRKGHFWHREYYDHYIRSNSEFINIAWYILNNPVKAKLVSNITDWKFYWIEKQLSYELGIDL